MADVPVLRWYIFLLVGIFGHSVVGSCQEGFAVYKTGGPCYRKYTEAKNWTEARQVCLSLDADLPKVDDAESYAAMDVITSGISKYYWIGLNDLLTENSFYWLDGSRLQNPKWDLSHPQPNGADEQNCVVGNTNNNLWEDKKCRDTYPFICEYWEGNHVVTNTRVAVPLIAEAEIKQQYVLQRKAALGLEDCFRHCLQITACDRFSYQPSTSGSLENCFLAFLGPRTSDSPSEQEIISYSLRT